MAFLLVASIVLRIFGYGGLTIGTLSTGQ
jgi:hypothetical protein